MSKVILNIDIENIRVNGKGNPLVFLSSRRLDTMTKKTKWIHNPNIWLVVDSKEQAQSLISILKDTYKLDSEK